MTRLTAEKILKEQSRDREAISALILTHKTLSDVSCLCDFKNLERLDLSFNSLSSLEGLSSCANLKWLSVSQNKLQSLKGIEGLSKLNVLNAGKNNIRSMNEVQSLVDLRALIVNDNQIVSICRLDHMKELNTLVLSRNPVCEIGESLSKVQTLTKLSLSKCQLQAIGASLKSCSELKELRLAHNDIKTLPAELAHNRKLQNMDLGNNLIARWSDMKVLESLPNLKNLNLQGNPVAKKDKLAKKVKKLVPNLQIFNAKPIDKTGRSGKSEKTDRSSFDAYQDKIPNHDDVNPRKDDRLNKVGDFHEQESKLKLQKTEDDRRKRKVSVPKEDGTAVEKYSRKKSKMGFDEIDVIDDGEIPFAEIFAAESAKDIGKKKNNEDAFIGTDPTGVSVASPKKKRKGKTQQQKAPEAAVSTVVEVGLGGPSAWDDEVEP